MAMITVTICPTCGSPRIRLLRKDWKGRSGGKSYIVPDLEFHECPDCGERCYSPEAMRQIELHSPAFKRRRRRPSA
jgi:YgiT-type zinc finger domain-containing protein